MSLVQVDVRDRLGGLAVHTKGGGHSNQSERKAGRNILERQGGEPETALRTGIFPRSVSLVYPSPIVLWISDGIDGECGEGG
jgi:hypothetical protein